MLNFYHRIIIIEVPFQYSFLLILYVILVDINGVNKNIYFFILFYYARSNYPKSIKPFKKLLLNFNLVRWLVVYIVGLKKKY